MNMENTNQSTLYPSEPGFAPAGPVRVGGVIIAAGEIEYNVGRPVKRIAVRNTGDRPIQVGSHFHFFEVNRYLEFDRPAAFGCHLNIPATTAVRFEPGDEKQIELVPFAGKRRVIGFNGLVMGYTGDENTPIYLPTRGQSILRMAQQGFKSIAEAKAEDEYARYEQEQQRKKNAENK
ncbi:MAG: urease subunit beta [Alistipes sp.]